MDPIDSRNTESPRSSIHPPLPCSSHNRNIAKELTMSTARCWREQQVSEKAHDDPSYEQQTIPKCDKEIRRQVRSRPIPIKSVPCPELDRLDDEELRLCSLSRKYDWETWRMYDRILKHREKHPLSYGFNIQPQPTMAVPIPTVPTIFFPVQSVTQMTTVPHNLFSDAHEDEIFDLEM